MLEQIDALKLEIQNLTLKQIAEERNIILEKLSDLNKVLNETLSLLNFPEKYTRKVTPKKYVPQKDIIEAIKKGLNTPRELKNELQINSADLSNSIDSLKEKEIITEHIIDNQQYYLVNNSPLICSICEKPVIHFDIHHVNGNREDNSSNNIINVCRDCHQSIHGKRNNNPINASNKELLGKICQYRKIWINGKREGSEDDFFEESSK